MPEPTMAPQENAQAIGLLVERARGSIPTYRQFARLHSLGLIPLRSGRGRMNGLEIRRGSLDDLGPIVAFLRQHSPAKQFYPVYTEADFAPGATATLGFQVEDFLVACQRGDVVGVVGLWDRSGSKQAVVRGYSGALGWLKPAIDLAARAAGAQPLPEPGQPLRLAYASFICVADNDPSIFRVLLQRLYRLAGERGYGFLIVDLAEGDRLLAVARRFPHVTYGRRLYTVGWDDGAYHARLDGRIPFVETAAL